MKKPGNWYHELVGKKNCPIVDTWWQTETGGIMIGGPLADISPMKPAHAGYPACRVSSLELSMLKVPKSRVMMSKDCSV
jgi:acyl-coenzyme A synthetase/AMP-(fatty) acid ligase